MVKRKEKPEAAPDKPVEPRPRMFLLYKGPCTLVGGKRGAEFYEVSEEYVRSGRVPDELPADAKVFSGRIAKIRAKPGMVFSFEHPVGDKTQVFTDSRKWVRLLGGELVTEWAAAADAWEAARKLQQDEKRARTVSVLHEHLAPLRRAYLAMKGVERTAVLAAVIRYITQGRPREEDAKAPVNLVAALRESFLRDSALAGQDGE